MQNTGATLVDNRAHGNYTLVGSPTWGLVLNPLVAYTSTTVYTWTYKDIHYKYEAIIEITLDNHNFLKFREKSMWKKENKKYSNEWKLCSKSL